MDKKMKLDVEAYHKRSRAAKGFVDEVAKSKSVAELKSSLTELLAFAVKNKSCRSFLREYLIELVFEAGRPYMKPLPEQRNNVVFIPPEAAPIVMIPTFVPLAAGDREFFSGVKRLIARCNEFTAPCGDAVSEDEMSPILESAQEKFRVLDIIAPVKPLNIISLNNSHIVFNSQCGIGYGAAPEAVIFVYHPRADAQHTKEFIFAHEIGHAVHIALTGGVSVLPDDFDAFNERLNIFWQTVEQKREAFADVAAFAILNSGGLREYLPGPPSESALDCFDSYIRSIVAAHINKKRGRRK